MNTNRRLTMNLICSTITLVACTVVRLTPLAQGQDPLPSWKEGSSKNAILKFVEKTTTAGSPDFVPTAERIATFDQDGTLWVEHPMAKKADKPFFRPM